MERNRYWRRKKNFSKGRRKKNIAKSAFNGWWYEHDGQYIKGKTIVLVLVVVPEQIIVVVTVLR